MKGRDILGTLKMLFSRRKRIKPRVLPAGNRWAIEFEIDGKYQIWYTGSEEQARLFVTNLDKMGSENAELAG